MTIHQVPYISVILPAYNSADYINNAISSILQQSYQNFELMVILDPSTDNTEGIIKSFKDQRIRLIKNSERIGLIESLNLGIKEAKGNYIARMDSDDFSYPDRFLLQLQYFKKYKDLDICATGYTEDIKKIHISSFEKVLLSPAMIQAALFFRCPLGHPTIMVKSSVLKNNYYCDHYKSCEDYELWIRLSRRYNIRVIPKILLYHRVHEKAISSEEIDVQKKCSDEIRLKQLKKLDITPTEKEKKIHFRILCDKKSSERLDFIQGAKWIIKLCKKNYYLHEFPIPAFILSLLIRFFVKVF